MSNTGQRTAATDQAYLTIRSDILSGTLKEGERITEQRLAESLGLSRTPVREAISKLIHEGFVERGTGYTTRVAHFEDEELEQMFQIRKLHGMFGHEPGNLILIPRHGFGHGAVPRDPDLSELDRHSAPCLPAG